MSRVLLTALFLFSLCSAPYAFELAELQTATVEDLLLFFEEHEIFIATGSPKPVRTAPAVATVITSKDIEKTGARHLDEVLETVAGIHVGLSTNLPMTSVYSIRGIHTQINPHVLLMIDNIPVTIATSGSRPFTFRLPVSMISRIEIVRGPGSAVHGADAFAGTINVITKDSQDINGTNAGFRYGSFDTYDAWVQHGGTYGGWGISLGVEMQKSDGDDDRIVESDRQTFFDSLPFLNSNASLAPEALNTSYNVVDVHLGLEKDKWSLGFWTWLQDNAGLGDQATHVVTPKSEANIDLFRTDVNYNNDELARDWDFNTRLYYMYVKSDLFYHLFPPGTRLPIGQDGNIDFSALPNTTLFTEGSLGNPVWIDRHYSIEQTVIYSGYENHKLRLAAGYKYMNEDTEQFKNNGPGVLDYSAGDPYPAIAGPDLVETTDTEYVFQPDKDRTLWFLSFQDEWSFTRHWELTAGVRYDHYSDFGGTVNPRAALVWEIREDLTTKLLYGRAFRPPSFAELYAQNNPQNQGNEDLDAETIDTVELAFDYMPVAGLRTKLSLFAYEIDGIIEFVPDPLPATTNTARNFQDRRGHGFEIEIDWKAADSLELRSNFAYQSAKDKDTDEIVPDTPGMQFYLNPHWTFLPEWSLDSQFFWIAKRHRADNDTRPGIDDYELVNLTLRRRNVAGHWDFSIAVRNVFDEDIREPNVPVVPNDYPMEGRSLWAAVRYNF